MHLGGGRPSGAGGSPRGARTVSLLMEVAFWIAVALVLYAYAGYPAALALVALVRRQPVIRAPITPRVTFITTAYNEEARIAAKRANTLGQVYPADRLEIIVASDCSSDG